MGCGRHAEKIQIPLGKLEGLSREGVAGPTATTGLARRAPGPMLPNAITPKHKQSHQPLLSILYYPRRPPKSPVSNQSSIHSYNHPAARAGAHQHHSFPFSTLKFLPLCMWPR